MNIDIVGGFNPFEKIRQIGSFSQGSGWKFQKSLKAPASYRDYRELLWGYDVIIWIDYRDDGWL